MQYVRTRRSIRLCLLAFLMLPGVARAQYMRLTEFVDVRGAQLDSAMVAWRRHHATVSGSYSYSYFTSDNGRRYITEQLTSVGEASRNDSLTSVILTSLPNRTAWNANFYGSHGTWHSSLWKQVPELSTNPSNLGSAQLQQLVFRRVTIRHVRPGMEAEFRAAIREIIDADTKLKAVNPTIVYELVVGTGAPAYLFISYLPSQEAYWSSIADRAAKRAACNGCLGTASARFNATIRESENMSLTKQQAISFAR